VEGEAMSSMHRLVNDLINLVLEGRKVVFRIYREYFRLYRYFNESNVSHALSNGMRCVEEQLKDISEELNRCKTSRLGREVSKRDT
jgi:hypothetical protein